MSSVFALFFSPTGNTEKAVRAIAGEIAGVIGGGDYYAIDLTSPDARRSVYDFAEDDVVVIGTPVYAGRIPNKLLPFLEESVYGDGARVVSVVTYGNRAFDDAVKELSGIMYDNGMDVMGAAAVPAEHAFTNKLAGGRPDGADLESLREFGRKMGKKLKDNAKPLNVNSLPGRDFDKMEYYTPLKEDGTPAKFLKAMVVTDTDKCTGCGECRYVCPMNCFKNSVSKPEGTCIKCQGCIRVCPEGAKSFNDEDFLSHVKMIEENYGDVRKEREFWG